MRLERPDIVLFGNVLSKEECDELVRRSREKVDRSTAIDPDSGASKVMPDRTSYGTFFKLEEDEFIGRIDRRLAEVVNWPLNHAEGMQILNYRVGGEYKPHFDFFPPEQAGSPVHTAQGGQRIGSIVLYLNEVEEGGATIFPQLSLSVVPCKGDAVFFGYFNSRGEVDRATLHGGAPVVSGEKWIATKWLRQHQRG